jgi:hypothetical protein
VSVEDKNYYEDDDWDEDDWERFLQKADVRTAKYLELFETLHNHPDCDSLIAKEMGWNNKYEDCNYNNRSCDNCGKRDECHIYEVNQVFDNAVEYDETTESDVKDIIAYKKSYNLYIKLSKYFKNSKGVNADEDEDEDVLEAISASSMIPAKIAGGHGMGYEKDTLCGNIANCKRSLKNARKCVYLLEIVRAKSTGSDRGINKLISEAINVEREVLKRIEYLRSRIWWR